MMASSTLIALVPFICPSGKQGFRLRCCATAAAPCLVVPAAGDMAYKLYSLGDERIASLKKQSGGDLVGSSHGWLALWDYNGEGLLLSNPISGRLIKLPRPRARAVGRLRLSRSPDQDGCRAVLVGSRQFCEPRVSTAWTPINYHEEGDCWPTDFAYCSRRGIFSSITNSDFSFGPDCVCVKQALNHWSNRDPDHQIDDWKVLDGERIQTTWFWKYRGPPHSWKDNQDAELLTRRCHQRLHLVYADHHFHLPLVIVHFTTKSSPQKTAGFVVVQIEKYGNGCTNGRIKVVQDFKGLAIFVGRSQAFAIPADGLVLKPNSIYFAYGMDKTFDVGIFDYQNKTIAPLSLSLSHDQGARAAQLMWFTPNPPY